MSEKMDLDNIEEEELVREDDPVQEEMKKKKKSSPLFKDKKTLGMYVGGGLMTLLALYMIMDDGGNTAPKTKTLDQKTIKTIKENDIYKTNENEKEKAKNAQRAKMIAEAKKESAKTHQKNIQPNKANRDEIFKNIRKQREENKLKTNQAFFSSFDSNSSGSKQTIKQTAEQTTKRAAKRVAKQKKQDQLDKTNIFLIRKISKNDFRCFSMKDKEPLYKIINHDGELVKYKTKTISRKKLDGKLIKAKIKNKNVLFVEVGEKQAVKITEDRVFCDMDSRG